MRGKDNLLFAAIVVLSFTLVYMLLQQPETEAPVPVFSEPKSCQVRTDRIELLLQQLYLRVGYLEHHMRNLHPEVPPFEEERVFHEQSSEK